MNKPEPMTDQVLESAHYKHAKYQEESMRASGWFEYAEAIIAARDAQWEQMLAAQEPVAWIEHLAGALHYSPTAAAKQLPEGVKFDLYAAPQPAQEPNHTALLEQALEALVYHRDNDMQGLYEICEFMRKRNAAIAAIKEALPK